MLAFLSQPNRAYSRLTIQSEAVIIVSASVVVMVVVNCNYAVMDYLLYLIVSNFSPQQ